MVWTCMPGSSNFANGLAGHARSSLDGSLEIVDLVVVDWEWCTMWAETLHLQNVKWFGSHNWTTPQLWTATLILPDAPRCSQIGWVQSDVLSGALRLLHRCSWMLRELWNRIQEYPEQGIVAYKMLLNQTIRMCKFQRYWEYWHSLQDYSDASRTWSRTLPEWWF